MTDIDYFANPENIVEKQVIVIRTAYGVVDMINAFTDSCIPDANISINCVLEHGELEAGVGIGVTRECLTDSWDIFYATRTCGTNYKIPILLLLTSLPLDGCSFSSLQSNLPFHSLQKLYHAQVQTTFYWSLSFTISVQLRRTCYQLQRGRYG